jgi:hypothetical protein
MRWNPPASGRLPGFGHNPVLFWRYINRQAVNRKGDTSMDAILWEYRQQARKPGTYLALGVGMAAAYVAYVMRMPIWVWALVAAYLALVLIRLSLNPATAYRLTETALECRDNGRRRRIPLGTIADYSVDPQVPTDCLITLGDGSIQRIPCRNTARAAHLIALLHARRFRAA